MNIFDIKPGDTITAMISPAALDIKGRPLGAPKKIEITGTAVGFRLSPSCKFRFS